MSAATEPEQASIESNESQRKGVDGQNQQMRPLRSRKPQDARIDPVVVRKDARMRSNAERTTVCRR